MAMPDKYIECAFLLTVMPCAIGCGSPPAPEAVRAHDALAAVDAAIESIAFTSRTYAVDSFEADLSSIEPIDTAEYAAQGANEYFERADSKLREISVRNGDTVNAVFYNEGMFSGSQTEEMQYESLLAMADKNGPLGSWYRFMHITAVDVLGSNGTTYEGTEQIDGVECEVFAGTLVVGNSSLPVRLYIDPVINYQPRRVEQLFNEGAVTTRFDYVDYREVAEGVFAAGRIDLESFNPVTKKSSALNIIIFPETEINQPIPAARFDLHMP